MTERKITRRRAIKIMAGGALVTTIALPSRWTRPIVESIIVPAHAAASPPTVTTTSRGGHGGHGTKHPNTTSRPSTTFSPPTTSFPTTPPREM
jgi:hypothetical protein